MWIACFGLTSGVDDEDGDTEYMDLDASDRASLGMTNRNSLGGATSRYSTYDGDGEDAGMGDEEGDDGEEGSCYEDASIVGSEGHTTRRADVYSGVSLVRPYGSEAGGQADENGAHEYEGSEDGEQLSVSAYVSVCELTVVRSVGVGGCCTIVGCLQSWSGMAAYDWCHCTDLSLV